MNGVLLVDKPGGMTSFDVVRRVRRWCATRQVGHCGTLDPSATGVLPVAVGSATRLVEYLMATDKEYVAVMRLGVVTDSQDSDGRILETHPWQHVDSQILADVVLTFVGPVLQVPPMHSALKRDGVPLYKLARQGVEVEREPREVRIEAIDILAFDGPEITLRVSCSKGTYIRTLCHDIGRQLGCGAHMSSLRRTRCGIFSIDQCHGVADCEAIVSAGQPLPMFSPAEALNHLPGLRVGDDAASRLANGIAPAVAEVDGGTTGLVDGTLVRLLVNDQLAAVARYVRGGYLGRPGDFQLCKVFPSDFATP